VFSPDLRRLAAFRNGYALCLWNTGAGTGSAAGSPDRSVRTEFVGSRIDAACFRADGKVFAVAMATMSEMPGADGKPKYTYSDPRLQLVEVPSGQVLKEFKLSDRLAENGVAFSPRGDLLCCHVRSTGLELRDAETGNVRGPSVPMKVTSAAFSGDGKRLFVGRPVGTAELWELDALLSPAKN